MKPQWVLTERKIKKVKDSTALVLPKSTALPRDIDDKITFTECHQIQNVIQSVIQCMAQTTVRCHTKQSVKCTKVFKGFIDRMAYGKSIDFDGISAIKKNNSDALFNCIKTMLNGSVDNSMVANVGKDIYSDDKNTLLQQNIPMLYSYDITASLGQNNAYFEEFITQYLNTIRSTSQSDAKTCMMQKEVERRPIGQRKPLTYDQLFKSPWAPEESIEMRHQELTEKIFNWQSDTIKGNDSQASLIVHCLVMLIIFFSTESVGGLIDPKPIQDQQYKFCHLLHKYLKFRSASGRTNFSSFGHAVMISSYAREMIGLEQRRLPV